MGSVMASARERRSGEGGVEDVDGVGEIHRRMGRRDMLWRASRRSASEGREEDMGRPDVTLSRVTMHLPSVLPSEPAVHDATTTREQLDAVAGRGVASPSTLGIFICALPGCNRLFQFRDTLMRHRKRDHTELDGEDSSHIITWNA